MNEHIAESRLNVTRYTQDLKHIWDQFVPETKNGTFLLQRDYMDYHSDRFDDHSLMFYKGEQLIALLPAHLSGNAFCTHNGLTYGGLLLSYQATIDLVLEIFRLLFQYLKEIPEVERIIYRPVPHIYHAYPSEEDLYVLFRTNAHVIERKISSVVLLDKPLPFRTLHRRKLKKAQHTGLNICTNNAFELFWPILEANLEKRYDAQPVHSLKEMMLLHCYFPAEIELHRVVNVEGETIGGCVVYVTRQVAHVQYIGSTEYGRSVGALDYLFDYLLYDRYANKKYFDFGTSVEEGGRYLNAGLIFQKEGFGGRAVVYDAYELNLKFLSNDKVF